MSTSSDASKLPHQYLKGNERLTVRLIEEAKDWATVHGFIMRSVSSQQHSDLVTPCPLALLPSPFPMALWQQALDVQQNMNLLYLRVSFDEAFVCSALADVVKTDAFTARQLDMYKRVCADSQGPYQKMVLQIQRSDYMCHSPSQSLADCMLKQVEVNNIASSMGPLAECSSRLHRHLASTLGWSDAKLKHRLPPNRAGDTVAQGLIDAWYAYRNHQAVILFVTQGEQNPNISDQRQIDYRLKKATDYNCATVWLSLTECIGRLSYSEANDRRLMLDGETEVAVVYFRAGYVPDHYPGDAEWQVRLTMELSKAIKCPWIGLQLANTKKIQQVLANPEVLRRFLPEEGKSERVLQTFVGMWGLEGDSPTTSQIIETVRRRPHDYVLKPQLEGGGSNVYGNRIPMLLDSMSKDEREAYIIMERIQPLVVKNYLVRPSRTTPSAAAVDCVSELGVYGYLLGDMTASSADSTGEPWVRRNVADGHLLRTKELGVDEGGIMAGAAVIDSPFLVYPADAAVL